MSAWADTVASVYWREGGSAYHSAGGHHNSGDCGTGSHSGVRGAHSGALFRDTLLERIGLAKPHRMRERGCNTGASTVSEPQAVVALGAVELLHVLPAAAAGYVEGECRGSHGLAPRLGGLGMLVERRVAHGSRQRLRQHMARASRKSPGFCSGLLHVDDCSDFDDKPSHDRSTQQSQKRPDKLHGSALRFGGLGGRCVWCALGIAKLGPDHMPFGWKQLLASRDPSLLSDECHPDKAILWNAVGQLPARHRGGLDIKQTGDRCCSAKGFDKFHDFHAVPLLGTPYSLSIGAPHKSYVGLPKMTSTLAERLARALAATTGLSQAGLAKACSVKAPSVSAWFSGDTKTIKAASLLLAAGYLKVNPRWLLEGVGPMRQDAADGLAGSHPFATLDTADARERRRGRSLVDELRKAVDMLAANFARMEPMARAAVANALPELALHPERAPEVASLIATLVPDTRQPEAAKRAGQGDGNVMVGDSSIGRPLTPPARQATGENVVQNRRRKGE